MSTSSIISSQHSNRDARPQWFKPGTSGNPAGSPKLKHVRETLVKILTAPVPGDEQERTYLEMTCKRFVREVDRLLDSKPRAADVKFLVEAMDKLFGRMDGPIEPMKESTIEQRTFMTDGKISRNETVLSVKQKVEQPDEPE